MTSAQKSHDTSPCSFFVLNTKRPEVNKKEQKENGILLGTRPTFIASCPWRNSLNSHCKGLSCVSIKVKTTHNCDFPALPTKMGLVYTGSSPFVAKDDALILR